MHSLFSQYYLFSSHCCVLCFYLLCSSFVLAVDEYMSIIVIICIIVYIEINKMEKGFKNITNLTPKAQADRIRQI